MGLRRLYVFMSDFDLETDCKIFSRAATGCHVRLLTVTSCGWINSPLPAGREQ